MKIAFINGKGGVGKSTLCYLTALGLMEAGRSVSIEDLDPQKSLTSWLDSERDGLVEKGDFHLIDTRPAIDDESVHNAISTADRIVMPCSPSPGDITAAKATADVIRSFAKEDAKIFVALNMVKSRTNLSNAAPELLKMLEIPVLQTCIPDKQCIQRTVLRGWKALDANTQGIILKMAIEVIS